MNGDGRQAVRGGAAGEGPDEGLVREALGPDGAASRRALDELVRRYAPRVFAHCARVVGNADDAADATQDVLVKVIENLHAFDARRGAFGAWVYSIARNHCLNVLRARRVREGGGLSDAADVAGEDDPATRAFEDAEALERLLERFADVLDPVEVQALVLRYVEGVCVDDITRLLEIRSASGARGVLQRARRKLRRAGEWER